MMSQLCGVDHFPFRKLKNSPKKRRLRSPFGNLYFRRLSISCRASPNVGQERAPPSTPLLDQVCQKLEELVNNERPKKVRRTYGVSAMFAGNSYFTLEINTVRYIFGQLRKSYLFSCHLSELYMLSLWSLCTSCTKSYPTLVTYVGDTCAPGTHGIFLLNMSVLVCIFNNYLSLHTNPDVHFQAILKQMSNPLTITPEILSSMKTWRCCRFAW